MSDVTVKQLDEMLRSENWMLRHAAAVTGHRLDILINDEHWRVRRQVARLAPLDMLKQLAEDEEPAVRAAVAARGYCLSLFVHDPCSEVRLEVAKRGYGIAELASDPDWEVRVQIAIHGKDADRRWLMDDPHWQVRYAVAENTHASDILSGLSKDKEFKVQNLAQNRLLTIKEIDIDDAISVAQERQSTSPARDAGKRRRDPHER